MGSNIGFTTVSQALQTSAMAFLGELSIHPLWKTRCKPQGIRLGTLPQSSLHVEPGQVCSETGSFWKSRSHLSAAWGSFMGQGSQDPVGPGIDLAWLALVLSCMES